MNNAKRIILGLIVIIAIIIIPTNLISNSIKWIGNAIKWVVFIDNAGTGLPILAEKMIKGLCEAIIAAFALMFGISQKNPWIIAISIIVGFMVCIAIYAICKYIIIIFIVLALLLILYILSSIIVEKRKRREKNTEEIGG